MKMLSVFTGLSWRLGALRRDQRGVSAVEFAMLLPLMVTLYLGVVEVSQGVAINRKVTLTARTIADLASQASSLSATDMTNLLNASASVVTPYDVSKLKVVISQVKIDSNGNARVDWSDTLNGTKHGKGSAVTLPTALKVNDSYLIWSEVSYNYTPTIGYVVTGSMNLKDQIYMRPRLSDKVTYQ
jgi:Flp pilus assembly protein TadG